MKNTSQVDLYLGNRISCLLIRLKLDWAWGMTGGADPKMIGNFRLGQMGKWLRQGSLEGEILKGKIFRERDCEFSFRNAEF